LGAGVSSELSGHAGALSVGSSGVGGGRSTTAGVGVGGGSIGDGGSPAESTERGGAVAVSVESGLTCVAVLTPTPGESPSGVVSTGSAVIIVVGGATSRRPGDGSAPVGVDTQCGEAQLCTGVSITAVKTTLLCTS